MSKNKYPDLPFASWKPVVLVPPCFRRGFSQRGGRYRVRGKHFHRITGKYRSSGKNCDFCSAKFDLFSIFRRVELDESFGSRKTSCYTEKIRGLIHNNRKMLGWIFGHMVLLMSFFEKKARDNMVMSRLRIMKVGRGGHVRTLAKAYVRKGEHKSMVTCVTMVTCTA